MRIPNCPSFSTMPPFLRNFITFINMLCFILLMLFISGVLEIPSFSSLLPFSAQTINDPKNSSNGFTDVVGAFKKWDSEVGCAQFKSMVNQTNSANNVSIPFLQEVGGGYSKCGGMKMKHVSILVKGWKWIPDNLENLYSCPCGLSCLWTKSPVLADNPDALLFDTTKPPFTRCVGEPLRVYMDLEPERKRSGREDIFISYHAKDDLQSTYAGALFHNGRNHYVSPYKNSVALVYYWSSSSHCMNQRNKLAHKLLSLLPHHSFGKCLNNIGGRDKALSLYPKCANRAAKLNKWWDHLHCVMSHYKFVLAIENIVTESFVTEKLFYALDSGAVPIYFGAPNVMDFVPPHSIIEGTKFRSMEDLATYVKVLANDPVAYGEYHAWRRCGELGNYRKTRALSLDTLPCRLCKVISKKGGRNADAYS